MARPLAEGVDQGGYFDHFQAGAGGFHAVLRRSCAARVLAGRTPTQRKEPHQKFWWGFLVVGAEGSREVLMANGRRGGHAKKIQTVHWTYGSFSALAFNAGTVAINVFSAQHLPETLMRTRGEWIATVDGATGPSKLAAVGIGLIQVPEGTGTTVLWSPITDGDAPWIWADYAIIGHEEAVVDVIGVQVLLGVRRVIDSKAMRKLRNTELQIVIENASINSTVTMQVAGNIRSLFGS